jgi:hypothetical protein
MRFGSANTRQRSPTLRTTPARRGPAVRQEYRLCIRQRPGGLAADAISSQSGFGHAIFFTVQKSGLHADLGQIVAT